MTWGLQSTKGQAVPLVGVHTEGRIVDGVAQVSVLQFYVNDTDETVHCAYTFPLDSFSAVCGFEVEIDERRIVGEVKEKEEAKEEYKEAVSRGHTAALLKGKQADVFKMNVGNIPAFSRVDVWISYVTELTNDVDKSFRFLIPTAVAPRYVPISQLSKKETLEGQKWFEAFEGRFHLLDFECSCLSSFRSKIAPEATPTSFSAFFEVVSPSPILDIVSTSSVHPIRVDYLDESRARAFFSFEGDSEAIGEDFLVKISQKEPRKPRAIIEIDETRPGQAAAMVTILPEIELEDFPSELVFVVDRSGSMSGSPIAQTKTVLQLFIRALPSDCVFNIIGFGSDFQSLFPKSQPYGPETMKKAIKYISKIDADLGGTEILAPLEFIFKEPPTLTRQVFVLTDGEVSNVKSVISLVAKNAKNNRVFALGIGSSVSHALVEGMARAGNGNARFVKEGDRMEPVVIRMLKDSLQPFLHDISIDWGSSPPSPSSGDSEPSSPSSSEDQAPPSSSSSSSAASPADHAEPKKKSFIGKLTGRIFGSKASKPAPSSQSSDKPGAAPSSSSSLVPTPKTNQTPYIIPQIYTGTRFTVFCFLKADEIPSQVTVRAMSPDGPLSLTIEVERHSGNIVQKLVARSMLRDLDNSRSWFHDERNASIVKPDDAKNEMVRLGKEFNLVSKETSFIAVDYSQKVDPVPLPKIDFGGSRRYDDDDDDDCSYASSGSCDSSDGSESEDESESESESESASDGEDEDEEEADDDDDDSCKKSAPVFMTESKQRTSSGPARRTVVRKMVKKSKVSSSKCMEEKEEEEASQIKSLSVSREKSSAAPSSSSSSSRLSSTSSASSSISSGGNEQDQLNKILLKQEFDGSFASDVLSVLKGIDAGSLLKVKDDSVKREIWISILVLAFLKARFMSLQEQWELNEKKCLKWLRSTKVDLVSLQKRASDLISA